MTTPRIITVPTGRVGTDATSQRGEGDVNVFEDCVAAASAVIRNGNVLALPTDTVYGLAANAADMAAVQQLFVLKDRPAERRIAVLAADMAAVERLVELSGMARKLAEGFWPGPLTLVARCVSRVEYRSVAGGSAHTAPESGVCSTEGGGQTAHRGRVAETLGVRLPDHELVRRLTASGPLAVTSANLHGKPTPATAREVARLFPSLRLVIDGGCLPGAASTVVDVTGAAPVVLREGPITTEQILETAAAG